MLRHGSGFWLLLQTLAVAIAVVGAVALVVAHERISGNPARESWLLLGCALFVPGASMLSWAAFVQRAITLRTPRWAQRATWRRRAGKCPKCAYELRFDFRHGCPECGWGRSTTRSRRSTAGAG